MMFHSNWIGSFADQPCWRWGRWPWYQFEILNDGYHQHFQNGHVFRNHESLQPTCKQGNFGIVKKRFVLNNQNTSTWPCRTLEMWDFRKKFSQNYFEFYYKVHSLNPCSLCGGLVKGWPFVGLYDGNSWERGDNQNRDRIGQKLRFSGVFNSDNVGRGSNKRNSGEAVSLVRAWWHLVEILAALIRVILLSI